MTCGCGGVDGERRAREAVGRARSFGWGAAESEARQWRERRGVRARLGRQRWLRACVRPYVVKHIALPTHECVPARVCAAGLLSL